MPDHGLDEEKLQTLGGWAAGLRNDARPEVAAAGRAIELLIEEVERLHVLLWDMRLYPNPGPAADSPGEDAGEEEARAAGTSGRDRTLRRRLGLLRRASDYPHP